MNDRNAQFYFGNLGADVMRCVLAAQAGDEKKYDDSLARAQKTLAHLRTTQRPEAYEEGLLLLRALFYARNDGMLDVFSQRLNNMITTVASFAR
ncbi:MAG: hypothetical protein AAB805_01745 [Patescibacteria group bacterium]